MRDEKDLPTKAEDTPRSDSLEDAEVNQQDAPTPGEETPDQPSPEELHPDTEFPEPEDTNKGVPGWVEQPFGGYASEQDDTVTGSAEEHGEEDERPEENASDDGSPEGTVDLVERPSTRRDTHEQDETPYWMKGEHLEAQGENDAYYVDSDTLAGSGAFAVYTFSLVGIVTAIKLWLASRIGLGDSEAYYWSWSQNLSLSYYDHPPVVAWLIRLGTSWLGNTPLGVRVFSIALLSLATLLLYDLGARIFNDRRVGFLAALLFSFSPVFFIGGAAAAPDPALGFAWLLATWLFLHALERRSNATMLAVGVVVGFGLLSKYFMVLFWPAALSYLLLGRHRYWLASRWLWLAVLASATLFAPVLLWNMSHDWASFSYHVLGRHAAAGFDNTRLLTFLGGQFLYLSPLIALGLTLSSVRVLLEALAGRTPWHGLLFWFSVPILALFVALGTWTPEAEPHWPMIGYLLLFVVLADYLIAMNQRPVSKFIAYLMTGPVAFLTRPTGRGIALGWMIVPALILNAAFFLHIMTDKGFAFLPDGPGYNPKVDISNELVGWNQVGAAAGEILSKMPDNAFIASYHYTMCGQFAFATQSLNRQLACLSPQTDAYDFMDTAQVVEGRDALIVTDNRYDRKPASLYECGGGIRKEKEIIVTRAERNVRTFSLWVCNDYRGMLKEGTPPTPAEPPKDSPKAGEAPAAEAPAVEVPAPELTPPAIESQLTTGRQTPGEEQPQAPAQNAETAQGEQELAPALPEPQPVQPPSDAATEPQTMEL
jgi:undecaprenyl-diphosphatase